MDGRGRALDNVFVEGLWRTVKQEEVYLKAYETVARGRRQPEGLLPVLQQGAAAPVPGLQDTGGSIQRVGGIAEAGMSRGRAPQQ